MILILSLSLSLSPLVDIVSQGLGPCHHKARNGMNTMCSLKVDHVENKSWRLVVTV